MRLVLVLALAALAAGCARQAPVTTDPVLLPDPAPLSPQPVFRGKL